MAEISVGIIGVAGRMGNMLAKQVHSAPGCRVGGGIDHAGSPFQGQDIGTLAGVGELGLPVTESLDDLLGSVDVVIEFTLPEATVAHAHAVAARGVPMVIGTTGLTNEQEAELAIAGGKTPIVFAPNMSIGVTLLFELVEKVAATLDNDYDIEIVEMHHNQKIDAPSGTAIGLGRAAARGRKVDFDEAAVLSREGITGVREPGTIGFATLRGGDVIGEHSVIFAGAGERIEMGHKAGGRHLFADGAVRAARWVVDQKPGLYTIRNVLGLE